MNSKKHPSLVNKLNFLKEIHLGKNLEKNLGKNFILFFVVLLSILPTTLFSKTFCETEHSAKVVTYIGSNTISESDLNEIASVYSYVTGLNANMDSAEAKNKVKNEAKNILLFYKKHKRFSQKEAIQFIEKISLQNNLTAYEMISIIQKHTGAKKRNILITFCAIFCKSKALQSHGRRAFTFTTKLDTDFAEKLIKQKSANGDYLTISKIEINDTMTYAEVMNLSHEAKYIDEMQFEEKRNFLAFLSLISECKYSNIQENLIGLSVKKYEAIKNRDVSKNSKCSQISQESQMSEESRAPHHNNNYVFYVKLKLSESSVASSYMSDAITSMTLLKYIHSFY